MGRDLAWEYFFYFARGSPFLVCATGFANLSTLVRKSGRRGEERRGEERRGEERSGRVSSFFFSSNFDT
jgi:hypothetical protein